MSDDPPPHTPPSLDFEVLRGEKRPTVGVYSQFKAVLNVVNDGQITQEPAHIVNIVAQSAVYDGANVKWRYDPDGVVSLKFKSAGTWNVRFLIKSEPPAEVNMTVVVENNKKRKRG